MTALVFRRITKAMAAVIKPPRNSTSPVPIRLRMPSTSLMMRETSSPVLCES